jgi:hypothetical protein
MQKPTFEWLFLAISVEHAKSGFSDALEHLFEIHIDACSGVEALSR